MVQRWVVLAVLLGGAGCSQEFKDDAKHPIKGEDLVRDKNIALGMSEEVVAKKLGRPAMSLSNNKQGKAVSDWQYVRVRRAWQQADDRDLGYWAPPADNTEVAIEPQLDLLFIDGTLVAMADHKRRTFEAAPGAFGDPVAAEEIARLRNKFYPGGDK